jgi:hypothetical protein
VDKISGKTMDVHSEQDSRKNGNLGTDMSVRSVVGVCPHAGSPCGCYDVMVLGLVMEPYYS